MVWGCLFLLIAATAHATPSMPTQIALVNIETGVLLHSHESHCIPSNDCVDEGYFACHGRGQCCQGNLCQCNFGYSGNHCEVAIFEKCPNHCSGQGADCIDSKCICNEGFGGEDCRVILSCADQQYCSAHGVCVDGKCFCDTGFHGSDCSLVAQCPDNCSGQGLCNVTTTTCVCFPGYSGASCSVAVSSHCTSDCSGHGVCNPTGTCTCHSGFIGNSCDTAVDLCHCQHGECFFTQAGQPTCQCEDGWRGPQCNIFDPTTTHCVSLNKCSGRGICSVRQNTSRLFGCDCEPGYGERRDCGVVEYSVCESECSGHGICDDLTARCRCAPGWFGEDCSKSRCPSNQDKVCSTQGICRAVSLGGNSTIFECFCDVPFTGSACETRPVELPAACPNECSDHGVCVSDHCDCFEGWTGSACAEASASLNEKSVDVGEFQ